MTKLPVVPKCHNCSLNVRIDRAHRCYRQELDRQPHSIDIYTGVVAAGLAVLPDKELCSCPESRPGEEDVNDNVHRLRVHRSWVDVVRDWLWAYCMRLCVFYTCSARSSSRAASRQAASKVWEQCDAFSAPRRSSTRMPRGRVDV